MGVLFNLKMIILFRSIYLFIYFYLHTNILIYFERKPRFMEASRWKEIKIAMI